jgi:hypothetical protein
MHRITIQSCGGTPTRGFRPTRSSKPPSAEGYVKPKPKSLRTPGKNPTGGQQGHEGHTLKKAESPDHIVLHAPPATCDACGLPLPEAQEELRRGPLDMQHALLELIRGRSGEDATPPGGVAENLNGS